MKVSVKRLPDEVVELTISASADELAPIKVATLRSLNTADVKVAGFRAGKAPLPLVEKQLSPQLVQETFINRALNAFYDQSIRENKLRVVGDPQETTIIKFVPYSTLEFKVTVPCLGEVRLANYKAVRLQPPKTVVGAKDIEGVLQSLQKNLATKKTSEAPAQNGDEVVIDFSGIDKNKKAIPGADGKDYPLLIGSKAFIPGFEEKLIGKKSGEQAVFDVTFPKDYGVTSLQNQKVTFTVNIKQVYAVDLPAINDDLASKAGPFKTLAELKADIKKQLEFERQQEADTNFKQEILAQVVSKSSLTVPKTLIEQQLDLAEKEERQNLAYRGQTWEEHLKAEGVTEAEHRERNRTSAEEQVKAGLILAEIADEEAVRVTPEEIDIRLQLLKGQYKDAPMQAELDRPEARNTIANRLVTEKALQKLADYATAS